MYFGSALPKINELIAALSNNTINLNPITENKT